MTATDRRARRAPSALGPALSTAGAITAHLVLWRAHGPLVGVLDTLALAHLLDRLTRSTP